MRVAAAVALVIALAAGCGDPSGSEQAVHTAPVATDETWTAAASPHIVRGRIIVSHDATLTIEAGSTVLFDTLSVITFGRIGTGTLRVLGTPAQPVTLRSLDSTAGPGFWVGLELRSNTASEMHYVEVSGCGAQYFLDSFPPLCIGMGNPLQPGESPTLLVDHVTVRDALGGAVIVSNDAHFAPGSTHLSVLNMRGYVARMRAREAPRFPLGGGFAGNDFDEVRLTLDTLRDSATWAPGVPWTVMDKVVIEGPKSPVLTLPPGDTVRLRGSIIVGYDAPGGLRIGSENGPNVVLRAADTSWQGIELLWHSIPSTITNAVLDDCGRVENSNPSFLYPCISVLGDYYGVLPNPAVLLRHVTLNALNVGLGLGLGGRLAAGSTDLTINGVGPPVEIGGRSSPSSLPPADYTRTFRDEIRLVQLTVPRDDSFPNLGVPYMVTNGIVVGDTTGAGDPTLTILPGVTMAFTGAGFLSVGEVGRGALRVVGTAANPITLTGQGPTPGAWTGVRVGAYADSSTVFAHLTVDYAGYAFPIPGSFQFYVDIGPIIQNTVIRNSSGCGIIIGSGTFWTTDFTDPPLGNTFTNNAGGPVCGP